MESSLECTSDEYIGNTAENLRSGVEDRLAARRVQNGLGSFST